MPKTQHGANAALNGALGPGSTQAHLLALFSEIPTFSPIDNGTELSGDGYARTAVSWDTAASGDVSNDEQISTPIATADWDEIVAIGLFDGSGNLHYFQELSSPITVLEGQYIRIPVGGLVVRER